nr:unnamed protein product [Callosobruchus analis]
MAFYRTIYFYITLLKIGLASSESSDSDRQIVKFKKDIDTIGNGFEDLILDAIDGIVKDAQLLIEADYDDGISDNSLGKNAFQKPYKLKNVIKKETEKGTVSLGKYRKRRSIDGVIPTPEELSNIINKEAEVGISSLKNFLSNLKPIKSDIENAVKVPTKIIETLTKSANLNKKTTDLKGVADMLKDLNPLHSDFDKVNSLPNFNVLLNSIKPKANSLGELPNLINKDSNDFTSLKSSFKNVLPIKSSFADDVKASLAHLGNIIKQGTNSVHLKNVLNNMSATEDKLLTFTKMLKKPGSLKDIANNIPMKLDNNIIKEFESTTMGLLDKFVKRSKRSAAAEQPVNVVEPPLTNSLHSKERKSDCIKDTNIAKERILELKEEIKNLHDIVVLLKDQQNAMSFLDHETKDIDDNFAQRYSKKDLLKILEHLSDNSLDEFQASKENEIPEHNTESTVHEELHKLKSDLKKAVHALNKTREIINYDKQIEKSLQDEIKRHRAELNLLKVVMERLLKNNTADDNEAVLGATLHQPKELPMLKSATTRESAIQGARASDLGNLRRLLQGLIDRRNRENSLSKLLQQLSGQIPASGRDLSDESEFLRVLQLAAKLIEQPLQGRIDDTDTELRRLQNAIESLRPKEEVTFSDDSQLKDLLDRLSKENSPSPIKPLQNTPGAIPADRYQELLKILQSRGKPKSPIGQNMGPHRPVGNLYTSEAGYGGFITGGTTYGPPHSYHNRYQSYRPLFYSSPPQYPRPPFIQSYEYSHPLWSDFTPVRPSSSAPYQDYEPPQTMYRPPLNFGGDYTPYYKLFEDDSSQGLYRPSPSAGMNPPQSIYRPAPVPSYGIEPLPPLHVPQQNFEPPSMSNFGGEPSQSMYRPQSGFGQSEKEQQPGLQLFPGSGYNVPPQNSGFVPEGSSANGGEASRLYPQTDNESGSNGGHSELEPPYNANSPSVDQNIPQPPQQPNNAKPPPNPPPLAYVKKRTRRAIDPSGYPEGRLYDELANSLKKYIFEDGSRGQLYNYGQRRTEDFKAQLDHLRGSSQPRSNSYLSAYQFPLPLQQPYSPSTFTEDYIKPPVLYPVTKTKPDVIATVIVKIFDHILNAVPTIVERIFGRGIYDLVNFSDYGYSNNGYNYNIQQNDLQKLFRGLGILGYGPLIFLKIIDGFTTFLSILKRNSFFRTFLLPALVLLLVAGSVIFLIWWLQPNDSMFYYNYNKAYKSVGGQSQNNNYQPQYDQNYRKYSNNYGTVSYNRQGYNSDSGNFKSPRQGAYVGNYI